MARVCKDELMLRELPYALLVGGAALLGMFIANILYDANIPNYISRKLGHFGGTVAFVLCPFLFSSFRWPFILIVAFSGLLLYARWTRPNMFRGVGGSGRPQALAEIHFPGTGIITIGILWGIFDRPWLAIVPLLFMGAGDGITGIIRSQVYHKEMKGNWGSAAMLATCLLLAYFIHPYWVGAVGAVVATLAERFTKTTRFYDDNASIPLCSALVMAVLIHFFV